MPFRFANGKREILAFTHPLAGKQFVKGGIEPGETASAAAVRELREESGLTGLPAHSFLAMETIGKPSADWTFFGFATEGLPSEWTFETRDDGGRRFAFFWLSLDARLDGEWHTIFHEAFDIIRRNLTI